MGTRTELHLSYEEDETEGTIEMLCEICRVEQTIDLRELEDLGDDTLVERARELGDKFSVEHLHPIPKECVRCLTAWDDCCCLGGPRRAS